MTFLRDMCPNCSLISIIQIDNFARQSLDPDAWWVGQMVGYLMRPSQKIQQFLKDAEKTIDFSTPVVGIHVR